MLWIFLFIVIAGLVAMAFWAYKDGKKMTEKAQASGAIDVLTTHHVDGLGLGHRIRCDLYLFNDELLITANQQKFKIELSKIRAAEYKSEQEIKEQSKSVVGRALIGTLLVPGLGTIVGGMSGVGNKKVKKSYHTYLIINFINSAGELIGVTFQNDLNIVRLNKFCSKINKKVNEISQNVITL